MSGSRAPALVTLGESMGLITAVETGPLEFARSFSYGIGGAESNVAIGVARLGHAATWIGRVGRDATGDMIERRLLGEQVRALVVRDDGFTGLMVKHRRFGTALSVDYHRAGSAGSRISRADLPPGCIEEAAILHVTGITPALSDSASDTVFHAVERARAGGVTVSVDVNYRAKLWPAAVARPVLLRLVAQADLVFAGVAEACLLLDAVDRPPIDELARAVSALGPHQVVIKDAERGCAALVDGSAYRLPALPVSVVDPVGAGDAFVAGYIAEHLAGKPAAQRLHTATAAGAFAVSVPGDCEGLPRRADLNTLIAYEDVAR
ncbi:sugar kinase [Actinocrinis puniceicyclus]|uniref:Sugar kinase n=1 Tax=Actinocrinis puniceicyclus TaxID=977794 RepID=A0A8J7WPS8_9ACTN|nr:sugar kinase [Actinocrinis puniceicyclus]MBS2966281.1 sugar kinase [Actinocrinis puniceicyclus]